MHYSYIVLWHPEMYMFCKVVKKSSFHIDEAYYYLRNVFLFIVTFDLYIKFYKIYK